MSTSHFKAMEPERKSLDMPNYTIIGLKISVYSDGFKFKSLGLKHHQYAQRRSEKRYNNEFLLLSVKHSGGSVVAWS